MRFLPFLIFIVVPLVELTILFKVSDVIGIGATILLVISTAVIGVSLLKRQGLAAIRRARETLDSGEFPVESVVDGACLLVAGAFLLTPGLLTDTVGFSLLIPGLRRSLARWLFNKFSGSTHFHTEGFGPTPGNGPNHGGPPPSSGTVIEGEFEDVDVSKSPETKNEDGSTGGKSSPWSK